MLTPEEFAKLSKEEQTTLMKTVEGIQAQQKLIATEEQGMKQMSMKDFEGKIEEIAKGLISQMTPVDKKFFAFPGIGKVDDDVSAVGKFQKTRSFLRALALGDLGTVRTMSEDVRVKANLSEGTNVSGGFLVPEEFKAEILRLAPEFGVIRRECRIIPMMSDVLNIPAAGGTDQSAIWTNEAAQILQTNPNFRQVVLTINKLAAIPKVTSELLADANVPTIQYLTELIAEQFAAAEDQAGFNGAANPFTGCLLATGVPDSGQLGGTGWSALSYQDLVNATGNVYSSVLQNGKFYMHRTVISHVRGLITTAGAPIFGGTANEVLGYPLVPCEKLPTVANITSASTAYAVFGDLRRGLIMGERGSIQMKLSTEATVDSDNLFEKDMVALRMIERVAIGVALPSSFTRIVSAAS